MGIHLSRFVFATLLVFCISNIAITLGQDTQANDQPAFFSAPDTRLREIENAIISASDESSVAKDLPDGSIEKGFALAREAYRRSSKNDTVENAKAFCEAAESAYKAHPESMVLAGLCGYATHYYRGSAETLKILIPVSDRWKEAPGIPLSLYRQFETTIMTVRTFPADADRSQFYLDGDNTAVIQKAEALAKVWARRIRPEDARRLYSKGLMAKYAEAELSAQEQALADQGWKEILEKYTAEQTQIAKRKAKDAEELRRFEEQERQTRENLAARERMDSEAYGRALESVLELRQGERTLEDLESKFSSLKYFQGRLRKDYPRVPHYEVFAADPATKADADLIDAAYKLLVLVDPKASMDVVHQINHWQDDPRAVFIAASSAARLNDLDEAQRLGQLLMDRDPNDQRAKRVLRGIEKLRLRNASTQPATAPSR